MALPKDYTPSERGGLFTKIEQGETKIRFVSDIKTGFVYWNLDNKPVRLAKYPKVFPNDVRAEKDGKKKIKDMWAGLVYNYRSKKIEIFEPTQATIHNALYTLEKNEEWGDLKDYDVTIGRKGEGLDTEYTVTPSPKKELSEDVKYAVANNELEVEEFADVVEDAISAEDNPF